MEWLREAKKRRGTYELMGVAKAHLRVVVKGETAGHLLQLKQCGV